MSAFNWGRIIDRFTFDFDGDAYKVIKFHPWLYGIDKYTGQTGRMPSAKIQFYVEELNETFNTIDAAVVGIIIRKNVGPNQRVFHEGMCRAMCVNLGC